MICPKCNDEMVILESCEVEVDYCLDCGGVWLDAEELELLFGDRAACDAFLTIGSPVDSKGEKSRKCPACNAQMTKEGTESAPPVLFDHCPNGDGLWFDRGELQTVLREGGALEKNPMVREWLEGIFGNEGD